MKDNKLAELYKTQQSLTEWLQDIDHADTEAIRLEDNEKRERLKVLKQYTGLPFDEPVQFEAVELRDKSQGLSNYLHKHGEQLCALRLIPKVSGLPKLRMRGRTVAAAYDWFLEQEIDAEKYRADYMPHTETSEWSTIFVVNRHGIQGEIITGGHHQLTQGFFESAEPIIFRYDFKTWQLSEENNEAKKHLLKIISHLQVNDAVIRAKLKKDLGASFVNNYLVGYFETVDTLDYGLWFVDYNRILGRIFENAEFKAVTKNKQDKVSGQIGCAGIAEGKVKIVASGETNVDFPEGGVLVCPVTTPDFVPLMKKAVAIVTDQGGILSHAAIVARELKKPCIVGTGNASKKLKDDQKVRVDADKGIVIILNNK